MSSEPFVPFGVDDSDEFLTLLDGVPPWLKQRLLAWVIERFKVSAQLSNKTLCLDVQLNTRVNFKMEAAGDSYISTNALTSVLRGMTEGEILRVVDYLLGSTGGTYMSSMHKGLDRILLQGRSKWMVGERNGRLGLMAREIEAVQVSVEAVLSISGQAPRMLARAWMRIHELEPDNSGAYSDAVRAAEIASVGVVVPNKSDATLGDVAGAIASDTRWITPLRPHPKAAGNEVLAGMLRTLYSGHRDRHGRPDYSEVTFEETRAAVLLAATIVDWFISGGVRLAPTARA